MDKSVFLKRFPVYFLVMFAFTAATSAVYNSFIPIYLKGIGFSDTLIGTLLALGPFVAILAQPFWGIAGDRTKSKNTVFRWILGGSAAAVLLYPVSNNFYYLFIIISIFTFFNASMYPIQDSITLEGIENTGWKYGNIRMGGTVGFSLFSILTGLLAKWNINIIFPLFAVVAVVSFIASYKIPQVKGHQSGGIKVSPLKLLKNKQLVLITCFMFFIFLTLGYYNSFFTLFFRQQGADNFLVGITMFLSSIIELPFLIFANKILEKLGVKLSLILAALIMAVRWMLFFFISNIYLILAVNLLHGFSFIVCAYCMTIFINKEVPKELRASGQTFYGLITGNVSRIIGSILGGFASDLFGMEHVFLYNSIINVIAVIVFGSVFLISSRKSVSESGNVLQADSN